MRLPAAPTVAALVLVSLAGCASAPVTGRNQFLLVPESQAINASRQAYSDTLAPLQKEGKVNNDPALRARVERITSRLIPQAIRYRPETQAWDWQIAVIDDPKTINAWCMAGGRMAIYTGLIQQIRPSDDEIAEVMGHEISHALAKHAAERMSVALASNGALQVTVALLGSNGNNPAVQQALQQAANVAISLPNSRGQESEADRIGIELAARAGYDPAAAVTLWQKMVKATGSAGKSDWLSTHPSGEKREQALAALIPQMLPYYLDKSERPVYPLKQH